MQIPKRNSKTGVLYLTQCDFGMNRVFELHVLKDFVYCVSAQNSLKMIRKAFSGKRSEEAQFITLNHINNCKRKIYNNLKEFSGNKEQISFKEYCKKNGFVWDENQSMLPDIARLYLREVFDLKHPIKIKEDS